MPAALYWPLLPAHFALVATFYLRSFARIDGKAYRRGIRDGLSALPRIWRTRGAIKRQTSTRDIARVLTWSFSAIVERRAKINPR
jgi:hypothetical protein